ncbi:MAG: DUF805 domain-containing protein [Halieaceae bacterium]|nr:DUF805 domain-containing protein [Halieaceae bacterium]
MDWYLKVLRNYIGFSGRAHRTEFWSFVLINLVISLVLQFVSTDLGSLYSLAVLIPSLAVGFRRLHDTGRSAWWWLIVLVPLVGWIVLIVFYCQDSEGDNEYGAVPQGN